MKTEKQDVCGTCGGREECPVCSGTGDEDGETCMECQGDGKCPDCGHEEDVTSTSETGT